MCCVSHRHVDVSIGRVGSFAPALVELGGEGLELRGPRHLSLCHGHTYNPRLCSLPRALLPRELRGGARSPLLLLRAQSAESQVQHVTNLICSSC